jgi:hypothetical protein
LDLSFGQDDTLMQLYGMPFSSHFQKHLGSTPTNHNILYPLAFFGKNIFTRFFQEKATGSIEFQLFPTINFAHKNTLLHLKYPKIVPFLTDYLFSVAMMVYPNLNVLYSAKSFLVIFGIPMG